MDFNGRFLDVRRSWRQGRLTDTKNKRRRRVDMSAQLAETLKALQILEKKRALASGREVSEWVFADDKGRMLNREMFRRGFEKCAARAGLRTIRVHDLRHTYASIRLNRGHDIADVSRQLGHSDISITIRVYGHLIPGKHKSQVDDLDTVHPNAPPAHPETLAKDFPQQVQQLIMNVVE